MLPVGRSIALSGFYLPRVFDCGVTMEFRCDGCDLLVLIFVGEFLFSRIVVPLLGVPNCWQFSVVLRGI